MLEVEDLRLVPGVYVHVANLRYRDGAQRLLTARPKEEPPRLAIVRADAAYAGRFREWMWRYGLGVKPRGFQVLPRRWVIESTFAWLGHARRPATDYERLPETAVAMIYAAKSRLTPRRLATGA